MRCEVVAIGTELLLGQIIDTNSSWIGEQLALAGIDSHFQVKVGDNLERMEFCLRQALGRSDAVICCGGLGPTQDDITRDAIAKLMGVPLKRDETIVDNIRKMFESRGRTMTDNNRTQADIPVGGLPIPQMPGTAPGLYCPVGDKVIYAVPGVPYEMREMMEHFILPNLQERSGQKAIIRSRVLKTWGNTESGLAEILAERIDELDGIGNPTLAFLASGIEGLKVRITAKAEDEVAMNKILADEEQIIRDILGDVIFGIDEETMESVVIDRLRKDGMTLSVAESLTGGIMASRLTLIDPNMEVFHAGLVSHTEFCDQQGPIRAVSAARHAQKTYRTDVSVAATLPRSAENKPKGTVYLCVIIGEKEHTDELALPGDRNRLRNYAVISLMNFCRKLLS